MGVLRWLFSADVVIYGHPILWREIVGNLAGLASVVGATRRRVWAWPMGMVANVLLFTVFFGVAFHNPQGTTLFGQAARQLLFIAVSAAGWRRWRVAGVGTQMVSSEPARTAVVPRWATRRERGLGLSIATVAVGLCAWLFATIGAGFPAPGWYYLADAWIFVASALATIAMALGLTDFWICWIAVDLVGVPELLHFQFYPSAALYLVYLGFVLWGVRVWAQLSRTDAQRVPQPTGQRAGAL